MRIISCGMTDVGMRRTHNEDNFLINDELQLFVVCDGMGGHAGGEVASAIAVHTLEEAFSSTNIPENPSRSLEDLEEITKEKLRFAVRLAGKRIHEAAQEERRYLGMGTTCLAMLVERAHVFVGHVGDSRGYLLREGEIQQVTEDHSLVNERIRAGLMTEEEAKSHKLKNVITRSLGFNEEVEVDLSIIPLRRMDLLIMCSDGLSNHIDTDEIGKIVGKYPPQEACRQLINLACERGGDDNITALIVRVDECP
jgi:PPM family protein phosphatase